MKLGIFTKTFVRPTIEETLDAVAAHGLTHVQFNMESVGLPTLPERIPDDLRARIADALRQRGLTMAALSATYNMLRPVDLTAQVDSLHTRPIFYERRLEELASACAQLGTRVLTLCTGTRDPDNMWRWHPENVSREAWSSLVAALKRVAKIAERHAVTLAFEPEVANVVDRACKARRLLDEVGSPWIKVVIDPANLFHTGELPRMRVILDEAFALIGGDIVLAHAKDLDHDGAAGDLPAGHGALDYGHYLRLLRLNGYDGPLILHGLAEAQVAGCVDFLRAQTY